MNRGPIKPTREELEREQTGVSYSGGTSTPRERGMTLPTKIAIGVGILLVVGIGLAILFG